MELVNCKRESRGAGARQGRVLPAIDADEMRITDHDSNNANSLTDAYGRTRPCFYLVRPDGYIAARGRGFLFRNGHEVGLERTLIARK